VDTYTPTAQQVGKEEASATQTVEEAIIVEILRPSLLDAWLEAWLRYSSSRIARARRLALYLHQASQPSYSCGELLTIILDLEVGVLEDI
jgi:hypothetical protein